MYGRDGRRRNSRMRRSSLGSHYVIVIVCMTVKRDGSAVTGSMSDDSILDHFEREKSIKLPAHLRSLLLFTGFDNKLSLSKLEPDDILELERLGRETLPRIVPDPALAEYLGPFAPDPSSFCIFPGHRKLLQELPQFYRNFSHKKRASSTESDALPTQKRAEHENGARSKPRDVDGEKQNIYALLTNWMGNFCARNLSGEEAAHVNKEMGKMKVDISREDPNQCFVTCCICLRELKIFRNQNGFWIMSNIHKHFKTHLNTYSNKKFSKNISISSSISNTTNRESVYVVENEIKLEDDFDES